MAENSESPRFTHYPLLWLAVCFACGIAAAFYSIYDWKTPLVLCFAGVLFTAFFTQRNLSLIFLSIAFVAAGFFSYQIEKQNVAENRLKRFYDEGRIIAGVPIEIEGVVLGKPEQSVDGFFFKLKAEKVVYNGTMQSVSGNVRFFAPVQAEEAAAKYERLDLQYGSRIRIACSPEREDRFLNPGVLSRKEILDQQDIDATATVKSPLLIEKVGEPNGLTPLGFIYDQRQRLILEFRDKFSVSTAGIMIASLLGDKYFLDKQTADLFREGGTFHILVISGLHITFIGGLTLLLVGYFTKKKLWQFIIAASFLWAYTLAVGAEVPVVRASLMFSILLFSQVIHRNGTLLNALGACGLILLVWRPQDLFTPSFQLTFISVAAIIAMAFPLIEKLRSIGLWTPTTGTPFPPNVPAWLRRICEMLYWRESIWTIEGQRQIWSANLFKSPYFKWLKARNLRGITAFIVEGILVSLVVQIWLLPLLVVYFHRVSVASILLNLWVGVFIALESFSALLAVFLHSISTSLALPVVMLTEAFNWLLLSVPALFVQNDWASFRLPAYAGSMKAVYFIYLIPVLVLGYILHSWDPFDFRGRSSSKTLQFRAAWIAGFIAVLLGVIIIFHPFSSPHPDGKLHIDFLDVGQGDSAFITFPNGETMLVDGGGRINYGRQNDDDTEIFEPDVPRIGEAVVSEFLWQKGYSDIDYILATHADVDHIQGLADVAKNFDVRAALFGRTPADDSDFTELSEVLHRKSIPVIRIGRGDSFEIAGVRVEVLHPLRDESPEAVSDNNHSVVLRLVFGNKSFLLTGDIEREAENEMLANPELMRADVVKVAHHGSRTSSTQAFVDGVNPDFAIIPVGKRSLFGHPHREVVERWKKAGAIVMTTGEKGTISISTDGSDLEIKTFLP